MSLGKAGRRLMPGGGALAELMRQAWRVGGLAGTTLKTVRSNAAGALSCGFAIRPVSPVRQRLAGVFRK